MFKDFIFDKYGLNIQKHYDISYFLPFCRCLDRAYEPVGPRGRFTPRRRDIRDLMSEIHSEQTLKDKPDCGVIDPAWCEADDEGQLFSIPCKRITTVQALQIHMDCI